MITKNSIPKHWRQLYESVLRVPRFPKQPIHALKTAIEEIAVLEREKAQINSEKLVLEKRLKELKDCEQDNRNLLLEKSDLEKALRNCQEGKSRRR
jgi:hypothetical protein